MKIYILRHGETDLNKKGVMQGLLDEPLSDAGRELAAMTGRAIRGLRFDHCISSPLYRARETAEILLRESGNDIQIEIDERIREIDFGVMEGKKLAKLGDDGYTFLADPLNFAGFAGGETIRDVCDRTKEFLNELILKDDGKTYLISTHGCAMRGMVNHLLDDPKDYWLGHAPYNCSFTVVEAEKGSARIIDIDKIYYDRSLIKDHFFDRKEVRNDII